MKRRMARLMVGPAVLVATFAGVASLASSATTLAASSGSTSSSTAPYGANNTPTLTLSRYVTEVDGAVTLYAGHLKYPESFVITIHSITEVIGSAQSDPEGQFTSTVVIPTNIPTGLHTITYTGNRGDTVSASIEVVQATSGSGAGGSGSTGGGGATTGGGGGGATLAFTGTDAIAAAGGGAGVIAIGGLLVLGARRRRRSSWTD